MITGNKQTISLYRLQTATGQPVRYNGHYSLQGDWPLVRHPERSKTILRHAQSVLNVPLKWDFDRFIEIPVKGGKQ